MLLPDEAILLENASTTRTSRDRMRTMMMQAWTLVEHGSPRQGFELREHPRPVPGDHEVLIRVEGFGLNYADVMAVKGLYREAPPLPSILGYEVVGVIEAIGRSVPDGLLGMRVVGMTRFGGYAEYAVTDHRACAVIPTDMSLGAAAALATQGCTAWYAARILCPVYTGERVLVHSAAGGVGHLLVQLLVHRGCEVFAVASGKEKSAYLKSLGVHHVVDRRQGNVVGRLRDALGGRRLDVSFNAVGGATFKEDMGLLGSGGRAVLFGGAERGGMGSLGTLRFVWRMGLIIPIMLMMRSRSILGINMLRISEDRPEVIAECLQRMVEECALGRIRPHVHQEFPSRSLVDAHLALANGATMGKVMMRW
ncbi:MAG: zinc-binding dehydrogenase [Flavobacteriales bacterium]|nr:zinc-binding dehydrogenase [Flavobacteriales bacterium]